MDQKDQSRQLDQIKQMQQMAFEPKITNPLLNPIYRK
jgi:hypothetical protein